ncbi:MAG: alpha-glucosidase C-terminal domain-containing protein [Ignavibacteriae bacterium]|nr:alpha-glucosidase C-terminal domain-containing protein [Ignavibacteriota bacterium]
MKKYLYVIIIYLVLILGCKEKENLIISENSVHPEWSYNASIYEVNIRQFTNEGTFKSFMNHLPELKKLGVDILWLMPIHPIGEKNRKGTLGSYYSVKDYKSINPNFGNEKDFKVLVDSIHALGMYVIIDWVANHTAWDHNWTKTNPEFYNKDSLGNFIPPVADWSDVIDLNFDNKNLRTEMLNSLKYWITEFNIDGYRCDVAEMVPLDFWKNARQELDKIKPVFMLAEGENPELHKNGFDMTYNWKLKDVMNNFAKGKISTDSIKNLLIKDSKTINENDFRMNFTSNHDENTWAGTEFERLGNLYEPFAILTLTLKGMPLIYNGQEAGMNKRLEFFEKDLIPWQEFKMRNIYTNILAEKKNNKSMWNGEKGGNINFVNLNNENVLSYFREKDDDKILVILNLSNSDQEILANDKNCVGSFKNVVSENSMNIELSDKINLKPYEYFVLVN